MWGGADLLSVSQEENTIKLNEIVLGDVNGGDLFYGMRSLTAQ